MFADDDGKLFRELQEAQLKFLDAVKAITQKLPREAVPPDAAKLIEDLAASSGEMMVRASLFIIGLMAARIEGCSISRGLELVSGGSADYPTNAALVELIDEVSKSAVIAEAERILKGFHAPEADNPS